MIKVLLTGSNGQLGKAIKQYVPQNIKLIALSRNELDISEEKNCNESIQTYKPDWIINAAAYTKVDQAEIESNAALAINGYAPAAFSKMLNICGGKILHISTDFVFDGTQSLPYKPTDQTKPLGVYGKSKLFGERAILENLGANGCAHILRTSWLYGPAGKNFLLTMLKLHKSKANTNETIKVITDQIGCPTSTKTLAEACWRIVQFSEQGRYLDPIMHWSDLGVASWYDFAVAIGELGMHSGLLANSAVIEPIKAEDYPTKAKRPHFSLLDSDKTRQSLCLNGIYWRESLYEVIKSLSTQ